MSPWKLVQTNPRVFERPLGLNEHGFYWDTFLRGTADCLRQNTVRVEDRDIFAPDNVRRAWMAVKSHHPLLVAKTERRHVGEADAIFVVNEADLSTCDEVEFLTASSNEEVERFVYNLQNGPRVLSPERLTRLFIFSMPEQPNIFHTVLILAHCITDGVANITISREFHDNLCKPGYSPQWDLEERLALARASEDLIPVRSAAKQRWRKAMAHTILAIRQAKEIGGHTLPNRITPSTGTRPAKSRSVGHIFSKDDTTSIINACKHYKATFGNVIPILGQVATARLLCRLRISGKISDSEWDFRRKEPMRTAGPLNLRPYLDPEWYIKGGSDVVALNIGYFWYRLPFMPLGKATHLAPGQNLPSYSDILTHARFGFRCRNVQKQAFEYLRHPLLLDMGTVRWKTRVARAKEVAAKWENRSITSDQVQEVGKPLSVWEQAKGLVMAHGGSSFGNTDHISPLTYPLGDQSAPKLELISGATQLQCRPCELYLGSSTSKGQMHMIIYWDADVYEEDIVKGWIAEIVAAAQHYLIQPQFTKI